MKLCECGCGQPTKIAPYNRPKKGITKGEPFRYIAGHCLTFLTKTRKRSPETIAKWKESHKGYKPSEETKHKVSLALKGKPHSAEHTEKVRIALAGRPMTAEEYRKFCEYQKNRPAEHNANLANGKVGKHPSAETKKKMSAAQKGTKHYNWKGGITPLLMQIRTCFQYRQWRSDIFTRDVFTCAFCGRKGVHLEADHYPESFASIFYRNEIKTFDQALNCEEFWNINNGRTLCRQCHDTTKRRGLVKRVDAVGRFITLRAA